MNGSPIEIGFFQFDNLVRNRIPFLLVHPREIDPASVFGPVERDHLRRWSVGADLNGDAGATLAEVAGRGIPKEIPVLLLSSDGESGRGWIGAFEAAGFLNVHWLAGGWGAVLKEASSSV